MMRAVLSGETTPMSEFMNEPPKATPPLLHARCAQNVRACVSAMAGNPGSELVRYARANPDVISLGQGEGDAPTPHFIIDEVARAMKDGETFYGPVLGLETLRQTLSDYYKNIYELDIPANRFFVTASGTNAMHMALAALLNPGDDVVAVTPIWRNLLSAMELAQANIHQVGLTHNADGRWSLDLDALFGAVTDNTRMLLINSPSNPTGWMATVEEMSAILDFARARNLWIVSDEVYGRITYDDLRAPSFLDIATDTDRLLVINSFSKSWAMTGWRLGWLVGPSFAESAIRDVALYNHLGPPTFTQYGAVTALRDGEGFIREQLDLWRGNRAFVSDWFKTQPRIRASVPDSTFYSFFRVEGENDSIAFAKRLVEDGRLLLMPGCTFGGSGKGYMRMCFAVSRPRLEEALSRLEKML